VSKFVIAAKAAKAAWSRDPGKIEFIHIFLDSGSRPAYSGTLPE